MSTSPPSRKLILICCLMGLVLALVVYGASRLSGGYALPSILKTIVGATCVALPWLGLALGRRNLSSVGGNVRMVGLELMGVGLLGQALGIAPPAARALGLGGLLVLGCVAVVDLGRSYLAASR
jgi:hypothetical protein